MRRYAAALALCLLLTGHVHGEQAKDIIDASGVKGGLVVHVGCGDGKLTAALRASEAYVVHGLDADAANVRKAREHVSKLGAYGKVTIDRYDGRSLPYIDNMVNLLVVTGDCGVSKAEMLRVLVPNGVVSLRLIKGGGTWAKTVKPWPAEIDDWTHWLHGPGNNAVSRDKRVGISRSLQWISGPLWGRHHNLLPSVSAMVSARGRVFTIIDEAPIAVRGPTDQWALVARDAFNGLVLWRRPIENWGWRKWSALEVSGTMRFKGPDQLFRRLVAVGDTVYVTPGFNEPVVAINAATGKTVRRYKGTENASEILFSNGCLFLARNVIGKKPGKDLLAVNAETGEILWQRKGYTGITSRGDELKAFTDAYLTVGADRVFFLDRDNIVALDAKTGKDAWTCPRPEMRKGVFGHYQFEFRNLCSLVYDEGIVFLGQIDPDATNLNKWQQKTIALLAVDAKTGKELWRHTGGTLAHFTPPDLFIAKGLAWTMRTKDVALVGLDVRTGEVKRQYPVRNMLVGHHHRCYRNKATENFYLAGEEGIEYIDFNSGELDVHHWLRGACAYGIMPANGLIYLPGHACGCHTNVKLNGFLALGSGGAIGRRAQGGERLAKGPAYGKTPPAAAKPAPAGADWPTYRHDAARSGCVAGEIPAELVRQWKTTIGGALTPPVIASDKVFVASPDTGRVYCLSAATGKVRWQFLADGPVDTPPTFHAGRLVFGTHGGSVYALQADDGTLIWRFRAAPSDRRMMAFGRLESPWPVSGSVLVLGDKAYCVAGRSMHLDSGLYVYALDVMTGKVVQQCRLQPDLAVKGELKGATLPDILVSDGKSIAMRNMRFDAADISQRGLAKGGSVLQANDGGLLDGTWINNAFWRYGKAQGQMLVFDGKTAYGVRSHKKLISKSYGQDVFTAGKEGYQLFAVELAGKGGGERTDRRGRKAKGKSAARTRWTLRTPVRGQAMVLTDKHVCLAGAPDIVDKADPWGAFEDRKGGRLEVYSTQDGKKLAAYTLESTPVYDGLAAANGRLFITLKNGSVLCMGAKGP